MSRRRFHRACAACSEHGHKSEWCIRAQCVTSTSSETMQAVLCLHSEGWLFLSRRWRVKTSLGVEWLQGQ
jgi:hypothetical protein